jgi:hypothetical protein
MPLTYREQACRLMEKWAREGVRESPMGSNWGGFVSVINAIFGRAPWCMAAIYKSFNDVGRPIIKTNTVTVFADWAKTNGFVISKHACARGDQVCFEWDGYWPGHYQWRDILDHLATIADRNGSTIRVVEGNSGDRQRADHTYSIHDPRIKVFVRVPGSPVDPRQPGAPYVTKPYPLPRLYKTAAGKWAVRLGKGGRVIFRGSYRAALKFYREKLVYWKNRNEKRR